MTRGEERSARVRGQVEKIDPSQEEVAMDMGLRLNWLAAALSFGFVAAVVLGMV
jgi:hypothetical protein